eukprot:6174410-Pleurochrysis_carterae.AAC.1
MDTELYTVASPVPRLRRGRTMASLLALLAEAEAEAEGDGGGEESGCALNMLSPAEAAEAQMRRQHEEMAACDARLEDLCSWVRRFAPNGGKAPAEPFLAAAELCNLRREHVKAFEEARRAAELASALKEVRAQLGAEKSRADAAEARLAQAEARRKEHERMLLELSQPVAAASAHAERPRAEGDDADADAFPRETLKVASAHNMTQKRRSHATERISGRRRSTHSSAGDKFTDGANERLHEVSAERTSGGVEGNVCTGMDMANGASDAELASVTQPIAAHEDPRQVVDEIRRGRQEAGEAGSELRALLSRALHALSHDLYSSQGALLAELVQNADDNVYDECVLEPSITFIARDGGDGGGWGRGGDGDGDGGGDGIGSRGDGDGGG